MKLKTKERIYLIFAIVFFLTLCVCEIFRDKLFDGLLYGDHLYIAVTRIVAGLTCMMFLMRGSITKLFSLRTSLVRVLCILPCMLIAVNNFPFIPFLSGEARITGSSAAVLMYALSCLAVGFFEEITFRGCIFTAVLQRTKRSRAGVFWAIVISSAIFGVIHLLNILIGAGIGATLLQVGYSFLIGGMCSIVLIKTGSVWYCVLLHAVYNFAGGVIPECGEGVIWSTPEIILTAVLSVVVAVYVIYLLVKIRPEEISALLNEQDGAEQNNSENL